MSSASDIEPEPSDEEFAVAEKTRRTVPNRRDLRSYGLRRRRFNTSHGRNRAVPHPLAGKWSASTGRAVREDMDLGDLVDDGMVTVLINNVRHRVERSEWENRGWALDFINDRMARLSSVEDAQRVLDSEGDE